MKNRVTVNLTEIDKVKIFVNEISKFESEVDIPTGIMAAEKHNPWIEKLLKYYDDKHFVKEDKTLDLTTNVVTITNIFNQNIAH